MTNQAKTTQLQIRVSAREKAAIQRAAQSAGMDMSTYILAKILPAPQERFDSLMHRLTLTAEPAFVLAELNDFLSNSGPDQFITATARMPSTRLPASTANYVAAMVEYAAGRLAVRAPAWVRQIPPLEEPLFGTDLQSLRLYLLTHSPAPFRRRNIFVDASLGDRV